MARGYTPPLFGLPKRPINSYIISTHQEQVAKQALRKLLKGRNPNVVPLYYLTPGRALYYLKNSTKFRSWKTGFLYSAENHIFTISSSNSLRVRPVRVVREDFHTIVPTSTLLQELDEAGFIFPRSYDVFHLDIEHVQAPQLRFDQPQRNDNPNSKIDKQ